LTKVKNQHPFWGTYPFGEETLLERKTLDLNTLDDRSGF